MPPLRIKLPGSGVVPEDLSLLNAILFAWEYQPDIREARGVLRQREGTTVIERSALKPRLSVDSSYSHITINSGGGNGGGVIVGNQVVGGGNGGTSSTTDRLSNRIGVTQLLFDFGRTRNLILQADLLRQAAAADLLASQNNVALTVKERFYGLTLAERLVEVSEEDLANREQQLALARALYDAGEMAPGDVVRAQSAVTASVVALNKARLDVETSRQDLLVSLGVSSLANINILKFSEPDLPNKNISYLLEEAFERRPDVLSAQRTVKAREAGLGAAYALNRPEFSTFTGVTYQGTLDGVQFPTLTAQLNLSFDIYDGGARAGSVTLAEGALEVSRADLERTKLEAQRAVTRALAELTTAEENVKAARAGVDSARQGVRIAEGRYRVALGSLTDVLDAQRAFVQARTDLATSQNELDLARARARHALAAPLEESFVGGG